MLVGKATGMFDKVTDYFKDNILDPIKKRLGIDDKFKDSLKESFISKGSKVIDIYKDVYGPAYNKIKDKVTETFMDKDERLSTEKEKERRKNILKGDDSFRNKDNEYQDLMSKPLDVLEKMVMETGVTPEKIRTIKAHSKTNGDFDINKYKQALLKIYYRDLNKKYNAKGTIPFMGNSMLSKGELLFNSKGMSLVNKTGAYSINEPTHILNTEDSNDLLRGMGIDPGPKVSIQTALGRETIAERRLKGNLPKNADGNLKIKGTNVSFNELIDTAKKYAPENLASAGIGGILGLAFGAPIIGAGIGAASNIIKHSDSLKDSLFGQDTGDGKRKGNGIIPKRIVELFDKYFPSMAKYGIAGILPGLLTPVGPIGGLLIGSTIGIIKNNEKLTEKYFGEEGKLKLGVKEKKLLSDMLPGALKGAGAGAAISLIFGGPFGILGNAVIGSALGITSSTSEFKDMMLGTEIDGVRSGGFVGALKDAMKPLGDAFLNIGEHLMNAVDRNIIDPIARFITPTIHAIPQVLGIIPRKITSVLSEKIFSSGKSILDRWLKTSLIAKAGTAIGKKAINITTSPFRLFGLAGDSIRKRQIKTGNADYMTAAERVEFMETRGGASEFDKNLAGMSLDDINSIRSNLSLKLDNKNNLDRSIKRRAKEIEDILDGYETEAGRKLSNRARKDIVAALNRNDTESVPRIIAADGFSQEDTNRILNGDSGLRTKLSSFGDLYRRRDRVKGLKDGDIAKAEQDLTNQFGKLGIKYNPRDIHGLNKLIRNLETEASAREIKPETQFALDVSTNEAMKEAAKSLDNINKLLENVFHGDARVAKDNLKAQESMGSVIDSINNTFSERADRIVGKDASPALRNIATTQGGAGLIQLAKKVGLSDKQIISSKGRIKEIVNLVNAAKRNCFDSEAVEAVSHLTTKQVKDLVTILSNRTVRTYLHKSKIMLKADDIKALATIPVYDLKSYLPKFNHAASNPSKYSNINSVITMDVKDRYSVSPPDGEDLPKNGLGSFLLNGIKSLFGGNKEEKKQVKSNNEVSSLTGVLSTIGSSVTGNKGPGDVDIGPDGKGVSNTEFGPAFTRIGTDGSVDYDTSDAKTKSIVEKLNLKEKTTNKLMQAQLKASEAIGKMYDTAKDKAKDNKLGLLELLFGGYLLAKSGVLKKVYEEGIKPLWTNTVYPWIKDTAAPWFLNNFLPTMIKGIGSAVTTGVSTLVKSLPSLLGKGINGLTGNRENVGATNVVNINNQTGPSGMVDETGKELTFEDIKNGNYVGGVYNPEGAKGKINSDGTVTFKDESKIGHSGAKVMADASLRAYGQGANGIGVKALKGYARAGEIVSYKGGKFNSKILKYSAKIFGGAMQLTGKIPLLGAKGIASAAKILNAAATKELTLSNAGSKLSASFKEKLAELVDKLMGNEIVIGKLEKAAAENGSDVATYGTKLKKLILKVFGEGIDGALKVVKGKTIAKVAGKVLAKPLALIFAVKDFIVGYDEAERILGIKDIGFSEGLLGGIINAVCGFLILPEVLTPDKPGSTQWIAKKLMEATYDFYDEKVKETEKAYQDYLKKTGSTKTKDEWLTDKYSKNINKKIKNLFSLKETNKANLNEYQYIQNEYNYYQSKNKGGKGALFGKGFSKQIDPSISNLSYNAGYDTQLQTIGDSACGPAAAVNVLESFGRGSERVVGAANFALSNGYKEPNGGTHPKFFSDYFSRYGLNSQTSSNKSQIMRNINSGLPTVLMGRDPNGVSSATPFGKTPHYVTVTGTDGRGHAIVQDPESKRDNQLYSTRDLLNKTSLGVSAGYGRGKINNNLAKITNGLKNLPDITKKGSSKISKAVVNFVKNRGSDIKVDANGNLIGTEIIPPGGLGMIKSYMGWQMITAPSSMQYKLREMTGQRFDKEGFGVINNRYVIACTTTYGRVGDYVDFHHENGQVIRAIIGDIKSFRDPGCNKWGHMNGQCIVEFIVDKNSWYPIKHPNPGTNSCHPEWHSYITKVVNGGNYLDNSKFISGDTSAVDGPGGDFDSSNSPSNSSSILGILESTLSNSYVGKAMSAFLGGGESSEESTGMNNSGVVGAGGDPGKLISAATKEIGYKEGKDNYTKYGKWYGMPNAQWCAMFVSWAANQAGIPVTVIPKYAHTTTGYAQMQKLGATKVSNNQAKPGDIMFIRKDNKNSGNAMQHTGIVEATTNGKIHTIEGNYSNQVKRVTHNMSQGDLTLLRPNYANTSGGLMGPVDVSKFSTEPADSSYANTRGSNPNKPLARYGTFINGIYGKGSSVTVRTADGYGKIEPTEFDQAYARAEKAMSRKHVYYGKGSETTANNALLNSIINILMSIADNTDKLNLIVSILNSKLGININASDVNNNTGNIRNIKSKLRDRFSNGKLSGYAGDIENESIYNIVSAMNAVASE